jgi:hypothetical protein
MIASTGAGRLRTSSVLYRSMRSRLDGRLLAIWMAMLTDWSWPVAGIDAIRPSGR